MLKKAESARQRWLENEGMTASPFAAGKLDVGTDCSGTDSPLFALQELKIRHQHQYSCDSAARCREWIRASHATQS